MLYATVAPFARLGIHSDELTYGLTPLQVASVAVGQLVTVRLRGRRVSGVITGLTRRKPGTITRLETLSELTPVAVPASLLELARVIRSWYWQPLGRVLGAMLPPPLIRWTGTTLAHQTAAANTPTATKPLTLSLVGPTADRFGRYDLLIHRAHSAGQSSLVIFGHAAELAAFVRQTKQAVTIWRASGSRQTRWQQWSSVAAGTKPSVVVGLRSAVFAPLAHLGLLIVDSPTARGHKDDQAPYYHTSRVAMLRAHIANCHLVLGDVIPPLQLNKISTIKLLPTHRPSIELLASDAARPSLLQAAAESWLAAERSTTFILINQLGAGTLRCQSCGRAVSCPTCQAALREIRGRLSCRQCHWSGLAPSACTTCGGAVLVPKGAGTEQIAKRVSNSLGEPVGVFDHVHADRPTTRLMVGTEFALPHLLADPPERSLLLGIDLARQRPTYDASERALRLIAQLATMTSRLGIETSHPDDPWFGSVLGNDFETLSQRELGDRIENGYPPAVTLIRFASREAAAIGRLQAALPESFPRLGPIIRKDTRGIQLIVKLPPTQRPDRILKALTDRRILDAITIDVDPATEELD